MQVPAISSLIQEFLPLGAGIAGTIASAIVFVAAFAVVYFVGKAVVTPLVDRSLAARDLEAHARKPIQKVISILVLFIAVAVAFGMAGFGNFLTALATIGAAATLGIAFAMQDVLKNFVAGVFIFTDKPFRIGDWIEWDTNSGVVEDPASGLTTPAARTSCGPAPSTSKRSKSGSTRRVSTSPTRTAHSVAGSKSAASKASRSLLTNHFLHRRERHEAALTRAKTWGKTTGRSFHSRPAKPLAVGERYATLGSPVLPRVATGHGNDSTHYSKRIWPNLWAGSALRRTTRGRAG